MIQIQKFGETIEKLSTNNSNEIKTYGQPTSETHSHLLKPGEFTVGLTLDEFKTQRFKMIQKIQAIVKRKNCILSQETNT